MKESDPKAISGFGVEADQVVSSNTFSTAKPSFCHEVTQILLAQPLNPLVKLEFEVIPRRQAEQPA